MALPIVGVILGIYIIIKAALAERSAVQEFCVNEEFTTSCAADEIIIMEKALYGQMSLGNCIKLDMGYIGCQSNVLEQFDRECSGQSSCKILVTDKHIESSGGCPAELSKYLQASYTCVKNGLKDITGCTTNKETTVWLNNQHSYISSKDMKRSCPSQAIKWILAAEHGQKLNASVIKLSQQKGETRHGSLIDPVTHKRAVIGDGPRIEHLLVSTQNEVEMIIPFGENSIDYILDIEVIGCPNLVPPNGAWITRVGDKLEVGCHSGEKIWKMECHDNQWVGAVGQCGYVKGTTQNELIGHIDERESSMFSDELSSNTLLFAVGSGLIFMSSVIFMIGVCLFKRQQKRDFQPYNNDGTLNEHMIPDERVIQQFQTILK